MASLTRGLPFADYLAIDALHVSTLKELDVSPLHYREACAHDRKDTPALLMGRLTHALILTPEAPAGVAIFEGSTRRGKAWDAFVWENEGAIIVKRDELVTAEAMRAAVMANPQARELLTAGEGEVTIQWASSGLPCRGRIDWLPDTGPLVELKSTRMIEPRRFMREFAQRQYHAQLAFYLDGLEAVGDPRPEPPAVIVVENQAPFDVCVYRVDEETIDAGRRQVARWLDKVRECMAAGSWPGTGAGGPIPMVLPDWAMGADLPVPNIDFGEVVSDG